MRKLFAIFITAAMAVWLSGAVRAEDYPNRPITITAVFGPASASDTICRIIADPLQQGARPTGRGRGPPRRRWRAGRALRPS